MNSYRFSAQFLTIFKKNLFKFFVDLTIRFTISEYTPKFAENCCAHKVSYKYSSNYYHFLLSSLLSLKTGCFSLIFQFVKRCMLQVRFDKYVHKINSNKQKISCYSLNFL